VNPGQDFDDQENEIFNPVADPVSADEVRRPNVAVEYPTQSLSPSASRKTNGEV